MSVVIPGLLLACAAVLVVPAAARLMLDPADPASRAWRLFLPIAAVVGMLALLLPAGGVALGLSLFYLLWTGYLTVGAATQSVRAGGPAGWSHLGSHLVLVAGAVLFVLDRAGWQAERSGWLLAGATVAHLVVGLTGVAIAWDRLEAEGARSWLLLGHPAGAALLIAGWVTGTGWLALLGALLLLGCAALVAWSARGSSASGADGSAAPGRRRARTGTVLAAVGLLGPVAGALLPAGLQLTQLGLAVTAAGLVVAAVGWALLLAPVSTACADAGAAPR